MEDKVLFFDVKRGPSTQTGEFEYNGRNFIYEVYFHTIKSNKQMVDYISTIFESRKTFNKKTFESTNCLNIKTDDIKSRIKVKDYSALIRVIDKNQPNNIASGTIQIINFCQELNTERDPNDLSKADVWVNDVCRTCDYENNMEYCSDKSNSPMRAFVVFIQEFVSHMINNDTIKLSIETTPPENLTVLTRIYSELGFVKTTCYGYVNNPSKEYEIMKRIKNDSDVIRLDLDSATEIQLPMIHRRVSTRINKANREHREHMDEYGNGLDNSSEKKYKIKYRSLKKRYNDLIENYNLLELNHELLKELYQYNSINKRKTKSNRLTMANDDYAASSEDISNNRGNERIREMRGGKYSKRRQRHHHLHHLNNKPIYY